MGARRTAAVLVAGALVLAPLAGCGGSDGKPHASPSASLAPGEIAPKAIVADLLAAMKGKRSARMALSLGEGVAGTADVSYGATTDARVTVHYGSKQLQLITVGGNSYIQQDAGGKYVKVTADDPAMGGFVKALAFIGPREAITAIAPGITHVHDDGAVGPANIRKYTVTVDGKVASQALAFGAGDIPKSITLSFVLADGLLALVSGEVGDQDLQVKVTRWGAPVHVTAPPASALLNP